MTGAFWHLYFDTRGGSGAYVDRLLTASHLAGISARAFVSAHYRYRTRGAVRWFFPITDRTERRNKFILGIRMLELLFAYFLLVPPIILVRPRVVLHLAATTRFLVVFARILQFFRIEIWATCHDIKPRAQQEGADRMAIFDMARCLIVHNDPARKKLIEVCGEGIEGRIRVYPFPFGSFAPILRQSAHQHAQRELTLLLGDQVDRFFLFIGVVRPSKGLDVLLNAWRESQVSKGNVLVIAGKWADPKASERQLAHHPSVKLIDRYITDEEFVWLLEHARYTVLPYHEYTHSGVLHSVRHHGGAIVISDIPMFIDTFPNYPLTFKASDASSLRSVLERAAGQSDDATQELAETVVCSLATIDQGLVKPLSAVFMDSDTAKPA